MTKELISLLILVMSSKYEVLPVINHYSCVSFGKPAFTRHNNGNGYIISKVQGQVISSDIVSKKNQLHFKHCCHDMYLQNWMIKPQPGTVKTAACISMLVFQIYPLAGSSLLQSPSFLPEMLCLPDSCVLNNAVPDLVVAALHCPMAPPVGPGRQCYSMQNAIHMHV